MNGPESRKNFFLYYENLCHCENTPFMHIWIREKISNGPVGRGLCDVTRRQFIKYSTGKLLFLPSGLTIKKQGEWLQMKCSRATTAFSTSYVRSKYWLIYQKPGGQEKKAFGRRSSFFCSVGMKFSLLCFRDLCSEGGSV